MARERLTLRQVSVVDDLRISLVMSSGVLGSVLKALEAKGIARRHHNSAPGYIYYTWTLTERGKRIANDIVRGRG